MTDASSYSDVASLYAARVAAGDLKPDPAQTAALPELDRIHTELRAAPAQPQRRGFLRRTAKVPEAPKGLYMWGGVGRGKSMLMDLFVETLDDIPVRRVHFHAFMQEIHAGMNAARKQHIQDPIGPVADSVVSSVKVLAFDEMQITDITDAMIVGRLFEKIFAEGVVVVTTSNRPPDDLYKDGLNRQLFVPFIEMIKDRMVVHELASETDYRLLHTDLAQVYFTPDNAETRAEINRIWEGLSGGHTEPLELDVYGRKVVLPAYRDRRARASFYDLCGHALGPADFLAVADAVDILVLEGIPRLSRSNFNEAKRFVTLVDTLYEAKVRLVCSAAATPDMLYVEGEGSFEFERTVSRLIEMQDREWGKAEV
ncbi:cell division protein ZapE [Chachezhania sediminis]|uniref:cell division protein ZapE n=1 Tax=Chachezhania sediminis TaxID=2599291 RepID=UPI00131DCCAF|nr:cell division protein ZapE [Chachezhania sediminis]